MREKFLDVAFTLARNGINRLDCARPEKVSGPLLRNRSERLDRVCGSEGIRNMLKSLRLAANSKVGALAAAGVLAGVAAMPASASPIPGITSIQDLINLNSGSQTDGVVAGGIVVDGVRFYDFQYSHSGTNSPDAGQVGVQTSPEPVGQTGLEFSFNWLAVGGTNIVSTIRYKVHAENGNPFDRTGILFNGDVALPPGSSGPGTFAKANEVVRLVNPDGTEVNLPNTPYQVITDGSGPLADRFNAFLPIDPPSSDLSVTKAINVGSSTDGIATISVVDNVFRQVVPEPGSLAVMGVVGGLTLMRRRRA